MESFRDLDVYRRASASFPKVYRLVRSWKPVDQRELGSQMIRAANSVHANIAEGFRKTPDDFKRYLANAIGSCNELLSHFADAHAVGLIDDRTHAELRDEYAIVARQLVRLKQRWK